MKTMTLYVDRDSIIHNIDPISKLLLVFVSISVTYMIPQYEVVLTVVAISIGLLLLGKVFLKIMPIIGLSVFLIISIILIQGMFHAENEIQMFSIGRIVFYQEGLSYAFLLTLRVINMLCVFGVLILTTKPNDLIETLIQKGMSPKIGYVFLSVLQIIPQMRVAMEKITDAQRARGMETEGHLFMRMKAFFPWIGPVVLNSLNDTRERAIALEVRGFSATGNRTFLNMRKEYSSHKIIRLVLIVILIIAVIWRLFL